MTTKHLFLILCNTSVLMGQIYSHVRKNSVIYISQSDVFTYSKYLWSPRENCPTGFLKAEEQDGVVLICYDSLLEICSSSVLVDTIKIFLQKALDFILCVVLNMEERVCRSSSDHGRQHWRVREKREVKSVKTKKINRN